MNPITVRICDPDNGHVCTTNYLDICLTSGTGLAKVAMIFKALDDALQARDIPWTDCIGLSVDIHIHSLGRHNSIQAQAIQKNQAVFTRWAGHAMSCIMQLRKLAKHSEMHVLKYEKRSECYIHIFG